MHTNLKKLLTLATLAVAAQAATAQVTFYEHPDFQGRSFTTSKMVRDFGRYGFQDRASSVVVSSDRWEVCEHPDFGGRCVVLRRGNYPNMKSMGLDDRASSIRSISSNARIDDDRWAPPPPSVYDARRRNGEKLFEADVVAVRAVVGQADQRCWVERAQVTEDRPNVGGALAGALIGGIIGHQIGGGTGRDIATAGGVVAGAAIGSRAGNNDERVSTQNVRRCSTTQTSARPDYWDVTYSFRGQEHTVQMTTPPGRTITVNRQGEPRA